MSTKALNRRCREARDWLLEACFPLWADRGVHQGGFLEALDLQHRSIDAAECRVRVQARQTYVFAAARQIGWDPRRAEDLVGFGVDILANTCRRSDGLFGRRLDLTTGELVDATADLYDTAFALYAFSSIHQPGIDGQILTRATRLITETLEAVETHLADPSGGYAESLPRPDLRYQNPHMHLFEACLGLARNPEQDAQHLTRAGDLYALCLDYFIDPDTGTLGEYFLPGSWRIPAGDPGEIVEPGHQFEWVWLMSEYARLTSADLPIQAGNLYAFACKTMDEKGRTFQSCKRDGTLVDRSRRTWQQTEALKAHIAMWQRGDETAANRAMATFDVLMDEYLTPEGGWIDHYDAEGEVQAGDMPASTGYHVVLALLDMISAVEA